MLFVLIRVNSTFKTHLKEQNQESSCLYEACQSTFVTYIKVSGDKACLSISASICANFTQFVQYNLTQRVNMQGHLSVTFESNITFGKRYLIHVSFVSSVGSAPPPPPPPNSEGHELIVEQLQMDS